jgi:hypothetical protein
MATAPAGGGDISVGLDPLGDSAGGLMLSSVAGDIGEWLGSLIGIVKALAISPLNALNIGGTGPLISFVIVIASLALGMRFIALLIQAGIGLFNLVVKIRQLFLG